MRRFHGAIVVMFIAVISLPLAANLTGHDGADPGAENRDLATFADGPDKWFGDHFGFRAMLVRWYGESRLYLLGVSPTQRVALGRHGWFFYLDDGSVEDYTRSDPMTPGALRNWRDELTQVRDWLAARGIAYVFTIAPDKYAIYPEEMPPALIRITQTSRIDQVFEVVGDTGVAALDLRPALLAAKSRERVYQKTDTHWNERGAFAAYQQIIGAVRVQLPAVPPAWTRDDFEAVEERIEGLDLARMMGLPRVLSEADLRLVAKRQRRARVVEPPGASPSAEEGYLVTEIPGSSLPRAVIFRDSFTSGLVPFLSEHFSRAIYLWQNDFDSNAVLAEHPDVVIQQIVGRHLHEFIPSPELIPR